LRRAAALATAVALATALSLPLACAGRRGGGAGARAFALPEPAQPPGPPALVVLVSVAGLVPALYRGSPAWMPTLAAMGRAGVAAEAVTGVAPTSEYPAHATLVTGRRPAGHGIVADHRMGERGVRRARFSHASGLRAPTLWQLAGETKRPVVSLAWPTTVGASIPRLLPDAEARRGQGWLASLAGAATPRVLEAARAAGGGEPAADRPGPARDAVLVGTACALVAESPPPALVLLRLGGTRVALAGAGLDTPETLASFAALDRELARLLECLQRAGVLARSAVAVVGDHGSLPVHTVVYPNVALAKAGLVTIDPARQDVLSWSALARSNGGSAFVYAHDEREAVLARRALDAEAKRSGAFRIVPAAVMLELGADPEAWFGLEAAPGYAFGDEALGPRVAAAAVRSAGGYLPGAVETDVGFVAWGRGIRQGVRVPRMGQTDVAPTLARLLGVSLPEPDGRVLVGLLEMPAP
jgi:predicted AlkP superfamily pyrophosphatase or phosphodiesterase